jgi:TetR/AcrR family transcriptional regulator, transcriptional repressor of bet genes
LDVMVHVIQGSIGEYMLDSGLMQKVDLETYSRELIRILDQTVKAGGED